MWDFLGILIDQLGESIRWFFLGFFSTIVLLLLLFKNNILYNNGSLAFIKKLSYYLFIPLYIGILSCFYCATYQVEKDAKEFAKYSIEKSEKYIFQNFYSYISSLSNNYISEKFKTKEELADTYLKNNNYKKNSYSTKIIRWSLINGLKLIEEKAIENGTVSIGDKNINLPKIVSNYLSTENGITTAPFEYLKGMTYKSIHSYARKYYMLYFWMFMVVFLILAIDFYLTLKKNKKFQFTNPSTELINTQNKLGDADKKIE